MWQFVALSWWVAVATLLLNQHIALAEINVVAAGASFPADVYKALAFAFSHEVSSPITVEYTALTSTRGICRLKSYSTCAADDLANPRNIDWSAVTGPLSPGDYLSHPDLQLYPSFAGAVVPVYNLPGVRNLNLNRKVLARIFRQCQDHGTNCPPGDIVRWDDPDILETNPEIPVSVFTAAGEIIPVVWADRAGTTETFKKALASFDPEGFAVQFNGSLDDQPVWPNAKVIKVNTNRGVSSQVLTTVSSIGYVSLDEAVASGLPHVALGKSFLDEKEGLLRGSLDTVLNAYMEKGLDFGNNSLDPNSMTSDLFGTSGSEAWPISQTTYFAVRLNTLRAHSTCEQRNATLKWFEWFYTSNTASEMIAFMGHAPLPAPARRQILDLIMRSFKCNGNILMDSDIYKANQAHRDYSNYVRVNAVQELRGQLYLYLLSFHKDKLVPTMINTSESELRKVAFREKVDSRESSVIITTYLEKVLAADLVILPFAKAMWGVVFNLCDSKLITLCDPLTSEIVFSQEVIAGIITGQIKNWNDTRIADIQISEAHKQVLPNEPITIFAPPSSDLTMLTFKSVLVRNAGLPSIHYQFPSTFVEQPDLRSSVSAVASTINSLTFTQVNDVTMSMNLIKVASLRYKNNILAPGTTALNKCKWDTENKRLDSGDPLCWPLTVPYFMELPSVLSDSSCMSGQAQTMVRVAHFIISDPTPLHNLGLAPLDIEISLNSLNQYECFGRSILNPTIDKQLTPQSQLNVVRSFAALGILLCCLVGLWVFKNRSHKVIKASQAIFGYQILLGFILEICTVFSLTIEDDDLFSQANLDSACMANIWLITLGFCTVYLGLFMKAYRVWKVFDNPKLRIIRFSHGELLVKQSLGIFPVLLTLICWTAIDPLRYERSIVDRDPTTGAVTKTIGQCTSDKSGYFLATILVCVFLLAAAGMYLGWKNRHAPSEFSEGTYVSTAILVNFELLLLVIPLLFLITDQAFAIFVIKVLAVFLLSMLTAIIFFGPKIAIVEGFWDYQTSSPASKSGTSGSRSKEQSTVIPRDNSKRAPDTAQAIMTTDNALTVSGLLSTENNLATKSSIV